MKIKGQNYACTICGQSFTRRTSGNRHNLNLHKENSQIVLYTEYIIGRLENKYPPANPTKYRKRKNNFHELRKNHSNLENPKFRDKNNFLLNNSTSENNLFPNLLYIDTNTKINFLIDTMTNIYEPETILKICRCIKFIQMSEGEQEVTNLIGQILNIVENKKFNYKIQKLVDSCEINGRIRYIYNDNKPILPIEKNASKLSIQNDATKKIILNDSRQTLDSNQIPNWTISDTEVIVPRVEDCYKTSITKYYHI